MCDPLTAAAAVATVAGTYMQSKAQASAQRGINAAINANGEANDKLRRESQTGVLNSANTFTRENFDKNQQDATADIKGKLTAALTGDNQLPQYNGGQSENTRTYQEKKGAETQSKAFNMADALANLRGFGQGQISNTAGVQRAGEVVGMNQNKEAGNNAVLPIQIEAAKRKAQSPIGDILTGLGTAGTMAGLAGAGPSFSSLFTSGAGSSGGLVSGASAGAFAKPTAGFALV